MARLLLCCDETIYCHEGQYYFKSEDWKAFFYRYLRVFDELVLVTRCKYESSLGKGRVILNDDRIIYSPLPDFHGPKQYIQVYTQIGKILCDAVNKCDAALLRLPFSVNNRLIQYVWKRNIPYAVEVCACAKDMGETSNSILHRLLWAIQDNKIRKICYKADGVACVTKHYLQQFYYSKKPKHFTGAYSSLALEDSFYQAPKGLPQKPFYTITHVANQVFLKSQKGHRELVDAMVILKSAKKNYKLQFVGESYFGGAEELANYAKLKGVSDMISFPGYLSREQMRETLLNTDLVVFPSKSEGLPRVIIESMAFGIPCLSTPVGGIPELLPSELLVNCFNPQELADNITHLLSDRVSYSKISNILFNKSMDFRSDLLQSERDKFYKELRKLL